MDDKLLNNALAVRQGQKSLSDLSADDAAAVRRIFRSHSGEAKLRTALMRRNGAERPSLSVHAHLNKVIVS